MRSLFSFFALSGVIKKIYYRLIEFCGLFNKRKMSTLGKCSCVGMRQTRCYFLKEVWGMISATPVIISTGNFNDDNFGYRSI